MFWRRDRNEDENEADPQKRQWSQQRWWRSQQRRAKLNDLAKVRIPNISRCNLHKKLMKLAPPPEWQTDVQSLWVGKLELESSCFDSLIIQFLGEWFLVRTSMLGCWPLFKSLIFLSKSRGLFCYLDVGLLRPQTLFAWPLPHLVASTRTSAVDF